MCKSFGFESLKFYISTKPEKAVGNDDLWKKAKNAKGKKKKWYQGRVSHFVSKKSAIAYGESLKKKGLIDDFYVANYSRP